MAELEGGTVLVVDDNAENRALAAATLEDEGARVELAATGEQALALFEQLRPDCVLMDIRMPGLDGVATCDRLRALPSGKGVPIVFVTAQRDVDTFDRARDAGGDDFITKPYRPSELLTRVGAAIKLRRIAAERSELYEVVRRQRDDLMRLQLQKEQLVAFLVHDLKNPVNTIELLGQRILRDPQASARATGAAENIHAETQALLRMIMNLLDLSKADEGRLVPLRQSIDLGALFDHLATEMRPRANATGVTLAVTANGERTSADPDLLRRITENLVDNALRHAPEGSTIRLTSSRAGDMTEIRVADQGPGIPAEHRHRVFERFVQAGAEPARTSRGLGLAFCKLAVEAHGGRIWVEDASPGAVFCLTLPEVSIDA
ncbi:MAG: response regulator [Kofleriaceae bacterium]